jgi:hypothetical protein
LHQNQTGTWVFKNITNGTCGLQKNSLSNSVNIPLDFLTERHVTLKHGHHVTWYLGFWVPHHFLFKKTKKNKNKNKNKRKDSSWGGLATPAAVPFFLIFFFLKKGFFF